MKAPIGFYFGNKSLTAAAAAVAALQRKARDRITTRLGEVTAFTAATASPLPIHNSTEQRMLESMLASGAVVAVGRDTYFLDEAALRADNERRRRLGLTVVLIVLGALIAMLAVAVVVHAARG